MRWKGFFQSATNASMETASFALQPLRFQKSCAFEICLLSWLSYAFLLVAMAVDGSYLLKCESHTLFLLAVGPIYAQIALSVPVFMKGLNSSGFLLKWSKRILKITDDGKHGFSAASVESFSQWLRGARIAMELFPIIFSTIHIWIELKVSECDKETYSVGSHVFRCACIYHIWASAICRDVIWALTCKLAMLHTSSFLNAFAASEKRLAACFKAKLRIDEQMYYVALADIEALRKDYAFVVQIIRELGNCWAARGCIIMLGFLCLGIVGCIFAFLNDLQGFWIVPLAVYTGVVITILVNASVVSASRSKILRRCTEMAQVMQTCPLEPCQSGISPLKSQLHDLCFWIVADCSDVPCVQFLGVLDVKHSLVVKFGSATASIAGVLLRVGGQLGRR